MGGLGDLLELLHTATSRCRTIRACIHDWTHVERSARAAQAHAETTGTGWTAYGPPGDDPPPELIEATTHVWLARPRGLRFEREHPDGTRWMEVDDGERRWNWAPGYPATVGESRPGSIYYGFEHLFDPGLLLGRLTLEPGGEAAWAGRDGYRVRAVDRSVEWHGPPHLPEGADERELLVDAERGIVLRLASLFEGEEFAVSELVAVAFDEDFPPETFALSVPDGTEVVDMEASPPPRHELVTVEEAQRRLPFTVLVPRRVPDRSVLRVHLMPGDERLKLAPAAALVYEVENGTHTLSIRESAETRRVPRRGGEQIVENGQELQLWETYGRRQVGLERGGTQVLVDSDLDRDTLLEIARSLAPAPEEPPRLVDA
jgi:hypothetical protein